MKKEDNDERKLKSFFDTRIRVSDILQVFVLFVIITQLFFSSRQVKKFIELTDVQLNMAKSQYITLKLQNDLLTLQINSIRPSICSESETCEIANLAEEDSILVVIRHESSNRSQYPAHRVRHIFYASFDLPFKLDNILMQEGEKGENIFTYTLYPDEKRLTTHRFKISNNSLPIEDGKFYILTQRITTYCFYERNFVLLEQYKFYPYEKKSVRINSFDIEISSNMSKKNQKILKERYGISLNELQNYMEAK